MTTQRDRRIAERWRDWLPAISFYCRGPQHRTLLAHYQVKHTQRLNLLLDASISMRSIRRSNYDDPRLGPQTFDENFKLACQAHDERVGRQPGVKRTKEQLEHARTQRNRP